MSGVDTDDHVRAIYTTKCRDGKWTNAVFSWVVDRGGLNAYVCHVAFGYDGSHEKWIVELIKSILEAHAPAQCHRRHYNHLRVHARNRENLPQRGRCAVCNSTVATYCVACAKFYCIMERDCFYEHHTMIKLIFLINFFVFLTLF